MSNDRATAFVLGLKRRAKLLRQGVTDDRFGP
jgi:hypothetical protein